MHWKMSTFSVQVMIEMSMTPYFKMIGMFLMWWKSKERAEGARRSFLFLWWTWEQNEDGQKPPFTWKAYWWAGKPVNSIKLMASSEDVCPLTSVREMMAPSNMPKLNNVLQTLLVIIYHYWSKSQGIISLWQSCPCFSPHLRFPGGINSPVPPAIKYRLYNAYLSGLLGGMREKINAKACGSTRSYKCQLNQKAVPPSHSRSTENFSGKCRGIRQFRVSSKYIVKGGFREDEVGGFLLCRLR